MAAIAACGCFYITEAERDARYDLDGDGVLRPDDCDDSDPDLTEPLAWFTDADGDGHGDPDAESRACVMPLDGVTSDDDCDDEDPDRHPGARETCDGLDNDCDGLIDEDQGLFTWYADSDGDGVGVVDDTVEDCVAPEGFVAQPGDCDDTDGERYPGAIELCDGLDSDCDDLDDLDDPDLSAEARTHYLDGDEDGFGAGLGAEMCPPDPGWVASDGDCADEDPARSPGADEWCNALDDDCDGPVDEDPADGQPQWPDLDGDGAGDEDATPVIRCDDGDLSWVLNQTDCDDDDPDIFGQAPETCADGIDSNCQDGDTETPPDCQ